MNYVLMTLITIVVIFLIVKALTKIVEDMYNIKAINIHDASIQQQKAVMAR